MANDKSIHQLRFNAAVKVIENLDGNEYSPSDDLMRVFYGYYKQATSGPCTVPPPSYWDNEAKARWNSWKSLGNMTKETAMTEYVQEIKQILEILPVTEDVSELLYVLGDFYEFVDEDGELSTSVQLIPDSLLALAQNGNMELEGMTHDFTMEAGDDGDDEDEEDEDGDEILDEAVSEDEMQARAETEVTQDKYAELAKPVVDVTGWRGASPVDVGIGEAQSSATHFISPSQGEAREDPPLKMKAAVDLIKDETDMFSAVNCHAAAVVDNGLRSDSPVHPAPEEGAAVPRLCLAVPEGGQARLHDPQGEEDSTQCGNCNSRPLCTTSCADLFGTGQPDKAIRIEGAALLETQRCEEEKRDCKHMPRREAVSVKNVNKDIAMALKRLQENMQDVLQRLENLETVSSPQENCLKLRGEQFISGTKKRRSTWWPFTLSPVTLSMYIAWPLVVHWLMELYFQRKKKPLH